MDDGALIDAYRRDGVVVARQLLAPDVVAELDRHLSDLVGTMGPASGTRGADRTGGTAGIVALDVTSDALARRIAGDGCLRALARLLVGREVEPFGYTYLVKPPASAVQSAWHQDGHPWSTDTSVPAAVTLGVALDPATPSSGGLRVKVGSHRGALHALEPVPGEHDDLFGWRTPPHLLDDAESVDLVLAPGDVSAHHPGLVHGSGPNRSSRRRAVLAVRYRAARP